MFLHDEVLNKIKSLANPKAVEGMARYGINPRNNYGVSIPSLRRVARGLGKDHQLAQQLWSSGIHDARILACMVDAPEWVTEAQMESWARDFDSWDVCDQCCQNLFGGTEIAWRKALEWSSGEEEFIKRAGFVLMARLCVTEKKAEDRRFEEFFPAIQKEAYDDRNLVKKAISWALRSIGKRNPNLNKKAIKVAAEMKGMDSKSARWIASDVIRELTSEAVQRRLQSK